MVTLYDTFGDGWGSAMWHVDIPHSPMESAAPNCTVNPVKKRICGKQGNFFMMVTNDEKEEKPENYWEVTLHVSVLFTCIDLLFTDCLDC